jgi:hypothetical protein
VPVEAWRQPKHLAAMFPNRIWKKIVGVQHSYMYAIVRNIVVWYIIVCIIVRNTTWGETPGQPGSTDLSRGRNFHPIASIMYSVARL